MVKCHKCTSRIRLLSKRTEQVSELTAKLKKQKLESSNLEVHLSGLRYGIQFAARDIKMLESIAEAAGALVGDIMHDEIDPPTYYTSWQRLRDALEAKRKADHGNQNNKQSRHEEQSNRD